MAMYTPFNNKSRSVKACALITAAVLLYYFCITTVASTGFIEANTAFVSQCSSGEINKYKTVWRIEQEDYSAFGSFEIRVPGGRFDVSGDTFQASFAVYASHVEREGSKQIPEVLPAVYSVSSLTVGADTDKVEIASPAAHYEKVTLYAGISQYVWQVEADGDYNIIPCFSGTGFFNNMQQHYD